MVLALVALRPEQDEEEARRHRHLREVAEEDGVAEADERDDRVREELHLADEDVRRLGARRDLLEEVLVELRTKKKKKDRRLFSSNDLALGTTMFRGFLIFVSFDHPKVIAIFTESVADNRLMDITQTWNILADATIHTKS